MHSVKVLTLSRSTVAWCAESRSNSPAAVKHSKRRKSHKTQTKLQGEASCYCCPCEHTRADVDADWGKGKTFGSRFCFAFSVPSWKRWKKNFHFREEFHCWFTAATVSLSQRAHCESLKIPNNLWWSARPLKAKLYKTGYRKVRVPLSLYDWTAVYPCKENSVSQTCGRSMWKVSEKLWFFCHNYSFHQHVPPTWNKSDLIEVKSHFCLPDSSSCVKQRCDILSTFMCPFYK